MPNDAKLGLVVGVGVVIAIGVIYYRRDASSQTLGKDTPATVTARTGVMPARGQYRPTRAKSMARENESFAVRRHVVADGETLADLAQRYYGDREMRSPIALANPGMLDSSETLTPGTELVIPDVSEAK